MKRQTPKWDAYRRRMRNLAADMDAPKKTVNKNLPSDWKFKKIRELGKPYLKSFRYDSEDYIYGVDEGVYDADPETIN